jgi:hypothetical protein
VLVHTNLTLSGAVAQYGRGVGIIQATATQIMNQFAKCLKDKLGQELPAAAPAAAAATAASATPIMPSSPSIVPASAATPVAPSPPPPRPRPSPEVAKPISGFSLMAKVLWASIVGLFKRS